MALIDFTSSNVDHRCPGWKHCEELVGASQWLMMRSLDILRPKGFHLEVQDLKAWFKLVAGFSWGLVVLLLTNTFLHTVFQMLPEFLRIDMDRITLYILN
jgi:hypothetical protein